MGKSFWRNTIFGTVFIFVLGWSVVSIFSLIPAFDPVGQALGDVQFTDLVYSQLREDPPGDTNVVVVNIGYLNRAGIAREIEIINKYHPAAIGLDTFFPNPKDPVQDSLLEAALSKVEHLVMVTKLLKYNPEKDQYDSLKVSLPRFTQYAEKSPYANMITKAKSQEDVKTCRTIPPQLQAEGHKKIAFGVAMASYLDSAKAAQFLARDNEVEVINYKGNILGSSSNFAGTFPALDIPDVMSENFVPDMIKGKVVIFGFLGQSFFDPYSIEDKFYTPLNKQYAGRGKPDMFGAVIHANIVSMIFGQDYINKTSPYLDKAVAVILCWLNVIIFSWIYYRMDKWYDGLTKMIQIVEILGMIALLMVFYQDFHFELTLTTSMLIVGILGDGLEVYYGVITNLFSIKGRRQLFRLDKLKKGG